MDTTTGRRLRIAEVAERTGFSTPTLRYYEDIGLMPPAERTEAGYRSYDDTALERLRFISRAKQRNRPWRGSAGRLRTRPGVGC